MPPIEPNAVRQLVDLLTSTASAADQRRLIEGNARLSRLAHDLPEGNPTRADMAWAIADLARRHGLVPELLAALQAERPEAQAQILAVAAAFGVRLPDAAPAPPPPPRPAPDALAPVFADLYPTELPTHQLLRRAGLSPAAFVPFGHHAGLVWWRAAFDALARGGGGEGATRRLLEAALEDYPGNPTLAAWAR